MRGMTFGRVLALVVLCLVGTILAYTLNSHFSRMVRVKQAAVNQIQD